MRKIKKINGFLVVKFNDREKREYEGTALDRFGNPDANYPALPGIKSKKQFKAGAVVAVALPYGDLTPAIIGEVEL